MTARRADVKTIYTFMLQIMWIRTALSMALLAFSAMASAQDLEHTVRFIWDDAPFPRAHASTIVEAPDGSLIAAWFGGSGEGEEDVGVWSSRARSDFGCAGYFC